MIALTSSYYKEYLPDGSVEKEKMKTLEIEAITQTMTSLERTASRVYSGDAARMLLIHHAILNQSAHVEHWTKYLYQLQDCPGQQSNLVMARHSIWLMTILPLNGKYPFQNFNYDWIRCGEEHSLNKVNGILGTSRKMLYLQYCITAAAKVGIIGTDQTIADTLSAPTQYLAKAFYLRLKIPTSGWMRQRQRW